MSKTVLGEQVVRFRAEGLKEAEKETKAAAQKLEDTWAGLRAKLAAPGKQEIADTWAKFRTNVAKELRLDNLGKGLQIKSLENFFDKPSAMPLLRQAGELDMKLSNLEKHKALMQGFATLTSPKFGGMARQAGDLDRSLANMEKRTQIASLAANLDSKGLRPALRTAVLLDAQMAKLGRKMEFEQLRAKVGTVRANLMWMGEAGSKALGPVASGLSKIASGAKSLAVMTGVGAGGFVAYFARGAMQGTVEGDALAKSIELLTRTVGNIFAPAVRIVTSLILRAATAFNSLSDDTKANIALWSLVAAGVALAIASMPIFGSVLTATFALASGMVMAFIGAVGLIAPMVTAAGSIIMATVSVVSALCAAAAAAWPLTLAIGIAAAVALLIGTASLLVAILTGQFDGLIGDLVELWVKGGDKISGNNKSWLGRFVQWTANAVLKVVGYWNVLMKQLQDLYNFFKKIFDAWDQMFEVVTGYRLPRIDFGQPSDLIVDEKALKKKFEKWTGWADALGDKIGEKAGMIKDLLADLPGMLKEAFGPQKFQLKFEASFESLQSSWERLQSADFRTMDQILDDSLKEQKQTNTLLERIADRIRPIIGMPAVGG